MCYLVWQAQYGCRTAQEDQPSFLFLCVLRVFLKFHSWEVNSHCISKEALWIQNSRRSWHQNLKANDCHMLQGVYVKHLYFFKCNIIKWKKIIVESSKDSIKELLERINSARLQDTISIYKNHLYSYTCNKQTEKEIKTHWHLHQKAEIFRTKFNKNTTKLILWKLKTSLK